MDYAIALAESKQLYGWGSNKYNQVSDHDKSMLQHFQSPVLISHICSANKIVCGSYHTIVLTSKPTSSTPSIKSINSSIDVPDEGT